MESCGFTLVELMIVVAVIGILAAIAYPSYVRYIVRSNRVDAQRELVQIQQMMERHYTAFGTYAGAALGVESNHSVGPAQIVRGNQAIYALSFAGVPPDASSYRIRATPRSDGINRNDGFLQIDSVDERQWDWNGDGGISDEEKTWNR